MTTQNTHTNDFGLEDVYNLEGNAADERAYAISMQRAINSGMAWKLQGTYGRAAMDAVDAGLVMLGSEPRTDFFGNTIPSRDRLVDGTVGTRGYVVEQRGEEWAEMLEAV